MPLLVILAAFTIWCKSADACEHNMKRCLDGECVENWQNCSCLYGDEYQQRRCRLFDERNGCSERMVMCEDRSCAPSAGYCPEACTSSDKKECGDGECVEQWQNCTCRHGTVSDNGTCLRPVIVNCYGLDLSDTGVPFLIGIPVGAIILTVVICICRARCHAKRKQNCRGGLVIPSDTEANSQQSVDNYAFSCDPDVYNPDMPYRPYVLPPSYDASMKDDYSPPPYADVVGEKVDFSQKY